MPTLTIGGLSKRSRCNVETIRYYERVGLMPPPPRSTGGHRLYEKPHVQRLTFIRRSRELGFPLQEIRDLLALVDGGGLTCEQVKAITIGHAREVRRKIDDLRRMERVLRDVAARCDGGESPDCPIIETLFEGAD